MDVDGRKAQGAGFTYMRFTGNNTDCSKLKGGMADGLDLLVCAERHSELRERRYLAGLDNA